MEKWKIFLAYGAIFSNIFFVFAAENSVLQSSEDIFEIQESKTEAEEQKNEQLQEIEKAFLEYQKGLTEKFGQKIESETERKNRIRREIEEELKKFGEYQEKSKLLDQKIKELKEKISTFDGQLQILEFSLQSTEKEIEIITFHIERKLADLRTLIAEKTKLQDESDVLKNDILQIFQDFQKRDEISGQFDEVQNSLRFVFTEESLSKNLWERQQIKSLEKVARKIFHELEKSQWKLIEIQDAIIDENQKLGELKKRKKNEEKILKQQIATKKKLKLEAKDNEKKFQEILSEAKEEMTRSVKIIAGLHENYSDISKKLQILEEEHQKEQKLLAQKQEEISNDENFGQENFEIGEKFLKEDQKKVPLHWPVSPAKGISAYYLDENYEATFGIPHHAIDIRTPQNTTIKSPALGYVYEIGEKEGGYYYIILAHRDNLMTVFGHISKFLVEEGDLVQKGEEIALSGGTPGTTGAGFLTTGPHLHFEVFKNGKHQNPLNFLPLSELPIEYIPDDFLGNL